MASSTWSKGQLGGASAARAASSRPWWTCTRTGVGRAAAISPCTSARCTPPSTTSRYTNDAKRPAFRRNSPAATRSTVGSFSMRYLISSAMEPMRMPCARPKATRSGRRAMLPSGFRISQITLAGSKPHNLAKSLPASVWPARVSTPPGCALMGKMWPGVTRCSGRASGRTAARTVTARSRAEMPVVTPAAASMETVKLVAMRAVLRLTISGKSSCAHRASLKVRQIKPRPCAAMKLMCSGVTRSAATTKSPSFSRSSSSTKMTMLPRRKSARTSAMESIGGAFIGLRRRCCRHRRRRRCCRHRRARRRPATAAHSAPKYRPRGERARPAATRRAWSTPACAAPP